MKKFIIMMLFFAFSPLVNGANMGDDEILVKRFRDNIESIKEIPNNFKLVINMGDTLISSFQSIYNLYPKEINRIKYEYNCEENILLTDGPLLYIADKDILCNIVNVLTHPTIYSFKVFIIYLESMKTKCQNIKISAVDKIEHIKHCKDNLLKTFTNYYNEFYQLVMGCKKKSQVLQNSIFAEILTRACNLINIYHIELSSIKNNEISIWDFINLKKSLINIYEVEKPILEKELYELEIIYNFFYNLSDKEMNFSDEFINKLKNIENEFAEFMQPHSTDALNLFISYNFCPIYMQLLSKLVREDYLKVDKVYKSSNTNNITIHDAILNLEGLSRALGSYIIDMKNVDEILNYITTSITRLELNWVNGTKVIRSKVDANCKEHQEIVTALAECDRIFNIARDIVKMVKPKIGEVGRKTLLEVLSSMGNDIKYLGISHMNVKKKIEQILVDLESKPIGHTPEQDIKINRAYYLLGIQREDFEKERSALKLTSQITYINNKQQQYIKFYQDNKGNNSQKCKKEMIKEIRSSGDILRSYITTGQYF